jgi:predicted AAA+ superfamily ATPase
MGKTVHPARYLSMDDAGVAAAARSDPAGFLAGVDQPVILDEVQRVPELFLAMKSEVDRNRRAGSFFLTGSGNVFLLPTLSESLAGRMEIATLWPFSQGELEGSREGFIDAVFSGNLPRQSVRPLSRSLLLKRILRGGYPEVVDRTDPGRRSAWFGAYLTTILQRDVRDFSQIEGLTMVPRLLALLAARAAGLLNISDVSRGIGIPHTTLNRYLALLEMTFLIQYLPPWSANLSKRLVKSPKLFLCDSGLMSHLLGLNEDRLRQNPELLGPLLESFVVVELMKQATWSKVRASLFHFRTHTGQEVDILIEDGAGNLVGVEVKASTTVTADDFKGLRFLIDAMGKRLLRGIVLYTGKEVIPFGDKLAAMPVSALWQLGARKDTPARKKSK